MNPALLDVLIPARYDKAALALFKSGVDAVRPGLYDELSWLPYTQEGFPTGLVTVQDLYRSRRRS
jgi:hypothetical protein